MTSPLISKTNLEDIVDNFSFLDDWEDRYGYLIELGRDLDPLTPEAMTDRNKVKGCVSQVWVISEIKDDQINFKGASDAHIVSGLVAIALTIFSGKTAKEILATDEQQTFKAIGLEEHLTPQRSNGLRSMVARIKSIAHSALD